MEFKGSRGDLTAEQLARYLFGDPLDRHDLGVIGRLTLSVENNTKQVSQVLRMGWALLIVSLAAVLTFIGDLLLRLHSHP